MIATARAHIMGRIGRAGAAILIASAGLALGACSQLGGATSPLASLSSPAKPETRAAAADNGKSELQKATEYWGNAYAKNPQDVDAALSYARNLKAMGEKQQAMAVLQAAYAGNGGHRALSGEYGRLALEFNQISVAQKLLEAADDPANPDWRIISARGTVLAKQGQYRDAIPFYDRALELAPDKASILNNLALAHAMEGNSDKAEAMLKRASVAGGSDARVSQNLALVLGLQGKYDEAKLTAVRELPADKASENVDYVRQIVKLQAKPLAVDAPAKRPELKGAAKDDRAATAATGWAADVAVAKP